jgi:hypothetical protein
MDVLINNLFFIDNIKIIDDIKGVIKKVMFSYSCIKIMPPTLAELNKNTDIIYTNEYNLRFRRTNSTHFGGNAKMSISLYMPRTVSYCITNEIILDFCIVSNKLNIKNIYWNNLINNPSLWCVLKKIEPFFYFL